MTASRPSSAAATSSAIPACAPATTAAGPTASTTATSSMPCAASRRPSPPRSTATASSPRSEYADAWGALCEALPRREACRRIVGLFCLAHDETCEAELAALIAADLAAGRLPDADILKARLQPRQRDLPDGIPVALTALAHFDALLEARA